jgi:putative copper resistance protein D
MIIRDSRRLAQFSCVVLLLLALGSPAFAQHNDADRGVNHDHGGSHAVSTTGPLWEGSREGKAYSEFNHHVAGLAVLVIGLTELREAMGLAWLPWSRFLLPAALLGIGAFLAVWSDHEAWPIGSLSFADTFLGHDPEMMQHKLYAVLALTVGAIEWLRRSGRLRGAAWSIPLPIFAVIGGLVLFVHMHGPHPSAHKIALHHAAMGTMAVLAGSSRLVSTRGSDLLGTRVRVNWSFVWAGFILLIGMQLLLYSE